MVLAIAVGVLWSTWFAIFHFRLSMYIYSTVVNKCQVNGHHGTRSVA